MSKSRKPRPIKMLFLGNSFTQRNNLPGLMTEVAAQRELRVETELIWAGGASLRRHWNAGRAAEAISTGRYDFVVLQEQSTLPVKNAARMAENVRLFDELIRRAGARTVLYMTWARQNEPARQRDIAAAYTSLGKELGATVAPVGVTWQRFLARHDHPALYDRDGSHPTLAGTYLAACVFLRTVLRCDPAGLAPGSVRLTADEVAVLQAAARK